MPFAVAFVRDLPFGRCVAVALPADGAVAEADLAGLHPDEATYARALAPARRSTWVGGRLALRVALRDLGLAPEHGPISSTARGAPALAPGLAGSVSHKETIAVALAARVAAGWTLGIDVEIERPLRADIASRVLTPDERRRIGVLAPAASARELLVAFSAKEAIYKALDPWVARFVSFQEVTVGRKADGRLVGSLALDPARAEGPFSVELHEEPVEGLILVAAKVSPRFGDGL